MIKPIPCPSCGSQMEVYVYLIRDHRYINFSPKDEDLGIFTARCFCNNCHKGYAHRSFRRLKAIRGLKSFIKINMKNRKGVTNNDI